MKSFRSEHDCPSRNHIHNRNKTINLPRVYRPKYHKMRQKVQKNDLLYVRKQPSLSDLLRQMSTQQSKLAELEQTVQTMADTHTQQISQLEKQSRDQHTATVLQFSTKQSELIGALHTLTNELTTHKSQSQWQMNEMSAQMKSMAQSNELLRNQLNTLRQRNNDDVAATVTDIRRLAPPMQSLETNDDKPVSPLKADDLSVLDCNDDESKDGSATHERNASNDTTVEIDSDDQMSYGEEMLRVKREEAFRKDGTIKILDRRQRTLNTLINGYIQKYTDASIVELRCRFRDLLRKKAETQQILNTDKANYPPFQTVTDCMTPPVIIPQYILDDDTKV